MYEIPVKLVRSYFDRLPGSDDGIKRSNGKVVHDYTVEVPSLKFGIPYKSNNKLWGGKVFYTSGYASNVDLRIVLAKPYTAQDAIIVEEEELEIYRACLAPEVNPNQTTTEGEFNCLDRLWNGDLKNHTKCSFVITENSASRYTMSFAPCMKENAPAFPVKVDPSEGPDKAVMHVLLRAHASQIKKGTQRASHGAACSYNDWAAVKKNAESVTYRNVQVKGAWIELHPEVSLLSASGMPLEDPLISPNNSGLAQVSLVLENTGDYDAYNLVFNLTLDMDVTIATDADAEISAGAPVPEGCTISSSGGLTTFGCIGPIVLSPGSTATYPFRVYYKPDKRVGASANSAKPLNMRVIASKSTASIDLTSTPGEKRVTQELDPFGIPYTKRADENMVVLSGRRGSSYDLNLVASHKLKDIRVYIWRAKLPSANAWTSFAVTDEPKLKEDVFARFLALGGAKTDEVMVDYVVAVSRTKVKVDSSNWDTVAVLTQSNVYEWRVAHSNLLLLLLLLPGLAIPAFIATAVFAKTKGVDKEPVRDLGMAQKQKFVPQELVDDEPLHMAELDTSMPPPPLPQRAAPAYEPPEPPAHTATSGKQYAIPTGPTYLRAGVPVNVIDN